MRKIYLLIALAILTFSSYANQYSIFVSDNTFTPGSQNAVAGDTIRWVWQSGSHSTTSLTIPGCATPWDAPMNSTNTVFQLVLPPGCAGTYNYHCKFHAGMTGILTVSLVGVEEISSSSNLIFPNPFSDKLSVIYKGIDKIVIYDLVGNMVKEGMLTPGEITELNVADLPMGTYFIRMLRNESVVVTRKLSKI